MNDFEKAFRQAMEQDTDAVKTIYKAFESTDNKFVRIAKTLNSSFEFASIIFLVPAFMIWLARFCDRMTKNDRAKEKSLQAQQNAEKTASQQPEVKSAVQTPAAQPDTKPQNVTTIQTAPQAAAITNSIHKKPTMAGFLNK